MRRCRSVFSVFSVVSFALCLCLCFVVFQRLSFVFNCMFCSLFSASDAELLQHLVPDRQEDVGVDDRLPVARRHLGDVRFGVQQRGFQGGGSVGVLDAGGGCWGVVESCSSQRWAGMKQLPDYQQTMSAYYLLRSDGCMVSQASPVSHAFGGCTRGPSLNSTRRYTTSWCSGASPPCHVIICGRELSSEVHK